MVAACGFDLTCFSLAVYVSHCNPQDYAYQPLEWSECSEPCGLSGVQTREVQCVDSSLQEVPNSVCESRNISLPITSQACNRFVCPTYGWEYGPYGPCSAACGGVRTRVKRCMSSLGSVVADSLCTETPEATTMACDPCTSGSFYYKLGPLSACSSSCGGVATRAYQCVNHEGVEVSSSECENNNVAPPASSVTTVQCNAGCDTVYEYVVSGWGSCVASGSNACNGVRQRNVRCRSTLTGTEDPTEAMCSGKTKPKTQISCIPDGKTWGECFCLNSAAGCNGNGDCDALEGVCECNNGWGGALCGVSLSSCASGVFDKNDACCSSGVLSDSGVCCTGVDAAVDRYGQCCTVSALSSNRVCNGALFSVSVTGEVGVGSLSASGELCESPYEVDACGVCGGVNSCESENDVELDVSDDSGDLADALSDPSSTGYASFVNNVTTAFAEATGRSSSDVEIRDVSASSSRRRLSRRALGSQSVAVTMVVVLRPPQGGFLPSLFTTSEMQSMMTTYASNNVVLFSVRSMSLVSVRGVVGNGVCEFGERCDFNVVSPSSCSLDECPYAVVTCPATTDGVCNGRGDCVAPYKTVTTEGICQCDVGYAGVMCSECAAGYARDSASGKCTLDLALAAQPPAASPAPPLPDDDGELSAGAIVGIVIGSVVVVAIPLVIFIVVRRRQSSVKESTLRVGSSRQLSDLTAVSPTNSGGFEDGSALARNAGDSSPASAYQAPRDTVTVAM